MVFECTQCGLCCKHCVRALDKTRNPEWMHPAIDLFPYKTNEDGSCEKMVDNQCSVYENRPLMCNIKQAAEQLDMPISTNDWYQLNYIGCAVLQHEERIGL